MNVRAVLVIPAALVVGVLAGCGQTGGGTGDDARAASAQLRMRSSEACNAPAWIRERAPEGLCTSAEPVVDDDVSPVSGR